MQNRDGENEWGWLGERMHNRGGEGVGGWGCGVKLGANSSGSVPAVLLHSVSACRQMYTIRQTHAHTHACKHAVCLLAHVWADFRVPGRFGRTQK